MASLDSGAVPLETEGRNQDIQEENEDELDRDEAKQS
jgi:hypothetical protein